MDEEGPHPLAESHDPTHGHRAAWVCRQEFDHLQHFFISVRLSKRRNKICYSVVKDTPLPSRKEKPCKTSAYAEMESPETTKAGNPFRRPAYLVRLCDTKQL